MEISKLTLPELIELMNDILKEIELRFMEREDFGGEI